MRSPDKLPQMRGIPFITDGGLETQAIFKDGVELPAFAAINLMRDEQGIDYLKQYFAEYISLAKESKYGLILESPTWRASSDWAAEIGVTVPQLIQLNKKSIDFLKTIKSAHDSVDSPLIISGCIGPRGDGYNVSERMSAAGARDYHEPQVSTLVEAAADFITALTLNYEEEAIGIVRAAREAESPVCISFTVETDGRLPNGSSLINAISSVDQATDNYVDYFMINCAHPTHFLNVLQCESDIIKRIKGIRANASCMSHAELDNSTTLDEGNPEELGRQLADLENTFSHINVLGGCCGTDIKHIEQICRHRSEATTGR